MSLTLVTDEDQIRRSLHAFNVQAARERERARRLLYRATHWVYDPDHAAFAPAEFAGYVNTDLVSCEKAFTTIVVDRTRVGPRRKNHLTHVAIGQVLREAFAPSARLRGFLRQWVQAMLGSGTLVDRDDTAWRFIELAPEPLPRGEGQSGVGSVRPPSLAGRAGRPGAGGFWECEECRQPVAFAEYAQHMWVEHGFYLREDPWNRAGREPPVDPRTGWDVCDHGVPKYKKCAICDPRGFADENGG